MLCDFLPIFCRNERPSGGHANARAKRPDQIRRPPSLVAIKAAETWVAELNDETRRAAFPAATAAGLATAAGCAAMGAFTSDGSLAPPDAPPVPPGEHHTAQMVAGSVIIAAVADSPEEMKAHYRLYVEHGLTLYRHLQAGS